MKKVIGTLSVAAAALFIATPASAAVTFSFARVGNTVVLTGSGSLNLTGAFLNGSGSQNGFVNPEGGSLAVGVARNGNGTDVFSYQFITSAGAFGTAGFRDGTADAGSVFGLDAFNGGGFVTVFRDYVSGSALSGSTTFRRQTFVSLGLTPGSYVYRLPNDTVTVFIPGASAVPETGTWSLMIAGFGMIGGAMRTRRRSVRLSVA